MKRALQTLKRLGRDESGATMIEYSLLIGLITVVVVVTIGLVGDWVGNQWTNLEANLT